MGVKKLSSELESGLRAVLIHVTGASSRLVSQASIFGANVAVCSSVCAPSADMIQIFMSDTRLCVYPLLHGHSV